MVQLSDYIFMNEDTLSEVLRTGVGGIIERGDLQFNHRDIPLFRGPRYGLQRAFLVTEKLQGEDTLEIGSCYTSDDFSRLGIIVESRGTLVVGKSKYRYEEGYVGRKVPVLLMNDFLNSKVKD